MAQLLGEEFPVHRFSRFEPPNPLFPPELWQVEHPPEELFIQGRPEALGLLGRLPARGLAVVGTRSCQSRSLRLVRTVLDELRGFELIVLSGLARGIDTQAHLCALEAGLPTIALQACGIDLCYPDQNRGLKRRILSSGGLIVSEFPPGAPPKPAFFIHRNRLIAAWSRATWVVEAPARSGALNTASWAARQDRPCYATTAFPGDPALAGNLKLLADCFGKPFQGTSSFGDTWLELESFLSRRRAKTLRRRREDLPPAAPEESSRPDLRILEEGILTLSSGRGTATLESLLDWSLKQGWTAERLFAALHTGSQAGRIFRCPPDKGPTSFELSVS